MLTSPLRPDELASIRSAVSTFMPEPCTLYRDGTAILATVCRIVAASQTQPAITQNPQTLEHLWLLHLPYGTAVLYNDTIDTQGFLYGVLESEQPRSFAMDTRVTCQRLGASQAPDSGQIEWANAVVTVTHADGTVAAAARPVLLLFQPPYEQGGPGSGGALLVPAQLWDVPGASYVTGDTVVVTSLSGSPTVPPQQQNFTVEFGEFLPGRNLFRATMIGNGTGAGSTGQSIFLPNATVLCIRKMMQQGDARRVNMVFPTAKEKVAQGAVTLGATLKDDVDADWSQGDVVLITALDGVSVLPAITQFTVGGVVRHPAPQVYLEADLTGSPI